jgi:hypothetical protein
VGHRFCRSSDWQWIATGIYWSWDEHAAEAHWGNFATGHVKWRLVADVSSRQIDWVSTLSANANPDMADEKEITLRENVPVKLVSYQQIRVIFP